QSKPGNNESQGWQNAWQNEASTYAVEVVNTDDVVKSVNFARENNLRLVVKGAGHDYLGRSNAPDSLLVWTHNMRDITYHEDFTPQNCLSHKLDVSAVTVSAGTRWIEAYTEVTTNQHRYVQGGGCTTVGAAGGFPQGGGFGSWSKEYGTGAGGIIEAEVVTANGDIVIANACQNEDLFWAIKGGGGGTFGIVTHLTYRTHPLPSHFGIMKGEIKAKNAIAYQKLIAQYLTFYRDGLNNENWGEQFSFKPDNTMDVFMVSQGISKSDAEKIWQPFIQWVSSQDDIEFEHAYIDIPSTKVWDYNFWEQNHPELVVKNTGPNARPGEYWWAPNSGEVFSYWYTYQSWWLPMALFDQDSIKSTAATMYQASRLAPVSIQINKGLAGASENAIKLSKNTSMHPEVLNAGALVIMSYSTSQPQLDKTLQGETKIQQKVTNINEAMSLIQAMAPNAGAYANEADYFQSNWQQTFWGDNYPKLLEIKDKYDPNGLFYCHHCVGSEVWSGDGMCRTNMKIRISD
ncbi:FAD-dependent oxidoreductase, partial [Francisellaceae bacterium]|nr:FAD-dependent oxidoreductase [Francisellaceae bacterium]